MSIALLFGVYRGNMLFFLAVVFFSILNSVSCFKNGFKKNILVKYGIQEIKRLFALDEIEFEYFPGRSGENSCYCF